MFRFSPSDYGRIGEVWNGPHPEDGSELLVEDGIPAKPQLTAPGVDGAFLKEAAKFLSR